jgi:hypothetical protein
MSGSLLNEQGDAIVVPDAVPTPSAPFPGQPLTAEQTAALAGRQHLSPEQAAARGLHPTVGLPGQHLTAEHVSALTHPVAALTAEQRAELVRIEQGGGRAVVVSEVERAQLALTAERDAALQECASLRDQLALAGNQRGTRPGGVQSEPDNAASKVLSATLERVKEELESDQTDKQKVSAARSALSAIPTPATPSPSHVGQARHRSHP